MNRDELLLHVKERSLLRSLYGAEAATDLDSQRGHDPNFHPTALAPMTLVPDSPATPPLRLPPIDLEYALLNGGRPG